MFLKPQELLHAVKWGNLEIHLSPLHKTPLSIWIFMFYLALIQFHLALITTAEMFTDRLPLSGWQHKHYHYCLLSCCWLVVLLLWSLQCVCKAVEDGRMVIYAHISRHRLHKGQIFTWSTKSRSLFFITKTPKKLDMCICVCASSASWYHASVQATHTRSYVYWVFNECLSVPMWRCVWFRAWTNVFEFLRCVCVCVSVGKHWEKTREF